MLFKKFQAAVQGLQMPVVPNDHMSPSFGSGHATAEQASSPAASKVTSFGFGEALLSHELRRRHFVPTIEK